MYKVLTRDRRVCNAASYEVINISDSDSDDDVVEIPRRAYYTVLLRRITTLICLPVCRHAAARAVPLASVGGPPLTQSRSLAQLQRRVNKALEKDGDKDRVAGVTFHNTVEGTLPKDFVYAETELVVDPSVPPQRSNPSQEECDCIHCRDMTDKKRGQLSGLVLNQVSRLLPQPTRRWYLADPSPFSRILSETGGLIRASTSRSVAR